MEKEEEKTLLEKICKQVETQIETIDTAGVHPGNVEYLYKHVDIHKDIANEKYWKEKIDMRYIVGSYNEGSYGRRRRDSRGRYMEGNYGRRGVDSKYRGEEMLNEMYHAYGEYSEGSNYGHQDSTYKLEIMADALIDFVEHIKKQAKSPEEKQIIEDAVRELSEK